MSRRLRGRMQGYREPKRTNHESRSQLNDEPTWMTFAVRLGRYESEADYDSLLYSRPTERHMIQNRSHVESALLKIVRANP
jgi:hypothetical protein